MLTIKNWSYFVYLFSDFIFVFQVKVELDLNARQKAIREVKLVFAY